MAKKEQVEWHGKSIVQFFSARFEVPMRHPSGDAELANGNIGLELWKAIRARGTDFGIIAL